MKKREPKIYSSFEEFKRATSGWQDYYPYRKPSHIYFSKTEILHIILALVVLTFAFSFALVRPLGFANISALPISFLVIGTGFLLHELGHKFTAQHFGLWAEFRAFPQGLIFALLFALIARVVFAAPGAVYIGGGGSQRESGIISLAGPLTNIGIALIALPFELLDIGGIGWIAFLVFFINSFLALFNMFPFGPLDGRKVFRWNYLAFGLTIGIAFLMVLFAYAPQLFFR
jgi:Zn-dependent protease